MSTSLLPHFLSEHDDRPVSMMADALAYAERGWAVFPLQHPVLGGCSCRQATCSSPGKHPRTRNGLKEGTTEPDQICRWWRKWPQANIGIVTGLVSGLCVLDVDGEEGIQSLAELEKQHSMPETLCVRTGRTDANGNRQGRHLYFRPPHGKTFRNSAGQLGDGLDIRGDGGYVVAPPSLHASGFRYEWCSPDAEIAEVPPFLTVVPPSSRKATNSVDIIAEGRRNSSLAALGGAMRRQDASLAAIESALLAENLEKCSPTLAPEEVKRIAASVSRYPSEQAKKTVFERRPDLVRLSDVEAKPMVWVWEPYLPLEMITLLSGDPGAGKTFISLAIAAAVTTGEPVLGGAGSDPQNVLYLSTENSPAHVLRPRFEAQGGNSGNMHLMRGTLSKDGETEKPAGVNLADVEQLELAISQTKARLIVIDPLQSYLGSKVDLHRSNETRPILDGIIKLAERNKCAVLIVRHLSKAQGGNPIYRGLGSIDITGAARSELFVAADPADATRRIMAHAKSNLGKLGTSISFTIHENRLVWGGPSSLEASDLLANYPREQSSAVDIAIDFLREKLALGPLPSNSVKEQAQMKGISTATLRRAEGLLGVIKSPGGFQGGWVLALPRVVQDSPESLTPENEQLYRV